MERRADVLSLHGTNGPRTHAPHSQLTGRTRAQQTPKEEAQWRRVDRDSSRQDTKRTRSIVVQEPQKHMPPKEVIWPPALEVAV